MIIPAVTVIEREARRSQRTERVPVLSSSGAGHLATNPSSTTSPGFVKLGKLFNLPGSQCLHL